MKNLFNLFSIFIISSSFAQSYDVNGNGIKLINEIAPTGGTITHGEGKVLDSIRELSEINAIDTSDAYPYISEDGLRLYYTNGSGGPDNNIYVATRSDIQSPFTNMQLLSLFLPGGSFSSWLTNDELELFYFYSSNLYHSSRVSIMDQFPVGTQVNLQGASPSFRSGPSLTQDLSQLYLYRPSMIEIYTETSPDNYMFSDSIVLPVGWESNPGQISKDGLSFYCSLREVDSTYLWKFSRASLNDPFSNPVMMDQSVNLPFKYNTQPSVSANGDMLVWARSDANLWNENQLYIAQDKSLSIIELTNLTSDPIVFPNPFDSDFKVTFELKNNQLIGFNLLDATGRVCYSETSYFKSGSITKEISLSDFEAGIYTLMISTSNDVRSVKLVKSAN